MTKVFRITVVAILAICLSTSYSLAADDAPRVPSNEQAYNQCLANAQIQYAETIGNTAIGGAVGGAIGGASVGGGGAIPGAVGGFIGGLAVGSVVGISAFYDAVKACDKQYLV